VWVGSRDFREAHKGLGCEHVRHILVALAPLARVGREVGTHKAKCCVTADEPHSNRPLVAQHAPLARRKCRALHVGNARHELRAREDEQRDAHHMHLSHQLHAKKIYLQTSGYFLLLLLSH
jgi:hypothetical protein